MPPPPGATSSSVAAMTSPLMVSILLARMSSAVSTICSGGSAPVASTVNMNASCRCVISTRSGYPIATAFFMHSWSYIYSCASSTSTRLVSSLNENTPRPLPSSTFFGWLATHSCFSSSLIRASTCSLSFISASYRKLAVATGENLAWSLPMPLRATQRIFSSWPLRSLHRIMSCRASTPGASCTGSRSARWPTGTTDLSAELRSLLVTSIVPSLHRTSSVRVTSVSIPTTSSHGKHMLSTAPTLTRGTRPRRCARNSSHSTLLFFSTSTRSIATVGTSAIMTRRRALATEASVSESTNLMCSWSSSSTRTRGWREPPPMAAAPAD
mmetsp:Transcript_23407/g.79654  ORF Transcript_23407/g.79654 Transcript_23407/m.79654 type:complete len:326 (+) Transcript_23407:789-1766(+)